MNMLGGSLGTITAIGSLILYDAKRCPFFPTEVDGGLMYDYFTEQLLPVFVRDPQRYRQSAYRVLTFDVIVIQKTAKRNGLTVNRTRVKRATSACDTSTL